MTTDQKEITFFFIFLTNIYQQSQQKFGGFFRKQSTLKIIAIPKLQKIKVLLPGLLFLENK